MSLPAVVGTAQKPAPAWPGPHPDVRHTQPITTGSIRMVDAACTTAVNIGLPCDTFSSLPDVRKLSGRSLAKPLPASTAGDPSIRCETRQHRKDAERMPCFNERCSFWHTQAFGITCKEIMNAGMAASSGTMRLQIRGGTAVAFGPLGIHDAQAFHREKQAWACPFGPGSIAASAATEPREVACLRTFGVTIPHASK